MAQLELRLLGPFQAILNGKLITSFESNKVRALLAYLGVERLYPQPRNNLAGLLWPDWPQQSAMRNLTYALADLRKNLADREANPPFLLITRESIKINGDADLWVDVAEYEQFVIHNQQSGGRSSAPFAPKYGSSDPRSKIESLKSAIALYRGPFLEGLSLPDSNLFEDWLLAKQEYFSQQMLKLLTWLAERCIEQGDYEQAEGYARRQIVLEPWGEKAHQQLMVVLSLRGERVQALAQFEYLRKALRRELNVEPSEETIHLYEQIREGKGETRKETVSEEGIPISTWAMKARHNLPAALSSFVGRERDIQFICQKIMNPPNRLVTLSGSGGVGKTRLALRVAQELLGEFSDGIWLVDLASLADPQLVLQAVATAFGVHESKDYTLFEVLGNTLRLKRLLLVLDNCEHLVEACAHVVGKLLQACPNLHILATSREILNVEGELGYPVPPLAIPDPSHLPPVEDFCQYEAVCLFIERAQLALPGFTATDENAHGIARICQRLDGIPLAIELAAARVKLLGVEQIAARLEADFRLLAGGSRTALPRQQTVRASIEWSYRLLTEAEQTLLRRLSVFAGGWTLKAAEAVGSGDNQPGSEVLDLLTQLANKSLVMVEHGQGQETRYRLLEMVRQFASGWLAESGEVETINDRHLAYFLSFAEEIEPRLRTGQRLVGLYQLRTELDNLRAALNFSLGRRLSEKCEDGLRLTIALLVFWVAEGLAKEGLSWLQKGLASTIVETPAAAAFRAKGLFTTGELLQALSDFVESRRVLEECVPLFRKIGDPRSLSLALSSLAYSISWTTDDGTIYKISAEAMESARQAGDKWVMAVALLVKCFVSSWQNDWEAAQACAEQSLALFLETGDRWTAVISLGELGEIAHEKKDFEAARAYFRKSLATSREANDKSNIITFVSRLGDMAYQQGHYGQMEAYFQECLELSREIGYKVGEIWSLHHVVIARLRQGGGRVAGELMMESLVMALAYQHPLFIKEGLDGVAGIAISMGKLDRAARLFGAVEALYTNEGTGPIDRADRMGDIARLRAQLDETAFQAAWDEGREMTLEQAVQEARAVCEQA